CHTNSLTQNSRLPNTGIRHTQFSVFFLQTFQTLVYISDMSGIFSENQRFRISGKNVVKVISQYNSCIYFGRIIVILRLNFLSQSSFLRSEEHTSELQSRENLVCRLLLEKKKKKITRHNNAVNV